MLSNIGAVIVTFNRLEKLKKALNSYEIQTVLPKYIIVVDNASTDGTKEYLKSWEKINDEYEKVVISLEENKGGAGGFYEGQKAAIEKNADWIMLADDDLYLDKNYFFGINEFIKTINYNDYSIICGKIIEQGNIAPGHRTRKNKWIYPFHKDISKTEFNKKEKLFCDFVSFCGIAINKQKLLKAGLVNSDYFIRYDDYEQVCRIGKSGKIVCLTKLFANHDIENIKNTSSWKVYYDYRNRINLIKKHFKFRFPIIIFYLTIKSLMFVFIKGGKLENVYMRLNAIKDGIFDNMGLHPVYRPGWKLKQ